MTSEENLTLYYYDDGLTPAERNEIETALESDAVLAARYAALSRELQQWSEPEIVPAPSHLKQRWHDRIDQAAKSERASERRSHKPLHFMSFIWGVGLTAALALGIGVVVFLADDRTRDIPIDDMTVDAGADRAPGIPASFTRGLQVHLQDSQWELANLNNDTQVDRTSLLMQIIDQNRMFERSADQNNAPQVARLLRAFEPILLRLASNDIAPADAEALRSQLAFELNVMLTKIANDTSNKSHST